MKKTRDLKIFTDHIEDVAMSQIELLLKQEAFKSSKVRIMPDVHAGKGCVIGFTGDLGDKVIPNIVGVDIGCGMLTIEFGKADLDLKKLDEIINKYIPSGFKVHEGRKAKFDNLQKLKCYRELKGVKRLERSIGTLGGGNHFIEVGIDEEGNKYLVIHTGSRNLGKQVAEYYQKLANKLCNYNYDEYKVMSEKLIADYKEQDRKQEIKVALKELRKKYLVKEEIIPEDLAYLEGTYRDDYLHDMKICQEFASLNRKVIAEIICEHINGLEMSSSFETIHNFIGEDNIVRKGAISAKKDELLLIPLNMRDGCIIGKGKGNPDWNYSAPHGAGRIMSRTKAKKVMCLEDFKKSMAGVYSTSVNARTVDEAPSVYKSKEDITKHIGDTIEIIKTIKPIYNFKASN